MANLKEWIEEIAGGEKIEAVVIGRVRWAYDEEDASDDYTSQGIPNYVNHPRGRVLTWKQAKKHLDYNFDNGYGVPGCEAVYVWTETKVIAIATYDGSTWPFFLPRNPTAEFKPEMLGGG